MEGHVDLPVLTCERSRFLDEDGLYPAAATRPPFTVDGATIAEATVATSPIGPASSTGRCRRITPPG
jgi:hypothetical protein